MLHFLDEKYNRNPRKEAETADYNFKTMFAVA